MLYNVGSKMSQFGTHLLPVMSLAGCRQLHLSLFSSRVRLVVSGVEHSSYSVLIALGLGSWNCIRDTNN